MEYIIGVLQRRYISIYFLEKGIKVENIARIYDNFGIYKELKLIIIVRVLFNHNVFYISDNNYIRIFGNDSYIGFLVVLLLYIQ